MGQGKACFLTCLSFVPRKGEFCWGGKVAYSVAIPYLCTQYDSKILSGSLAIDVDKYSCTQGQQKILGGPVVMQCTIWGLLVIVKVGGFLR